MGTCTLTAAALCKADGTVRAWTWRKLEFQGGEVCDNEKSATINQYYTDKHHFYLHYFTKKKKKGICPRSIIQPMLKTTALFLFITLHRYFQLLYKLTNSCATNCLSLSRYCP